MTGIKKFDLYNRIMHIQQIEIELVKISYLVIEKYTKIDLKLNELIYNICDNRIKAEDDLTSFINEKSFYNLMDENYLTEIIEIIDY